MEKRSIVITEKNRDGAKLWFEPNSGNLYTLETDRDFVLQYCRFIYDEIEENENIFTVISSVDPSGGPMISIGDKFENKTLESITRKNGKLLFLLK